MKKVLALVILVTLIFSVVACAKKEQPKPTPAPTPAPAPAPVPMPNVNLEKVNKIKADLDELTAKVPEVKKAEEALPVYEQMFAMEKDYLTWKKDYKPVNPAQLTADEQKIADVCKAIEEGWSKIDLKKFDKDKKVKELKKTNEPEIKKLTEEIAKAAAATPAMPAPAAPAHK